MNAWSGEAWLLAMQVLGHPRGSKEFNIAAVAAVFVFMMVMRYASRACGMEDCGWPRRIAAIITGLAVMMAAAVAAALYLESHIGHPALLAAAKIGAPAGALLLIGVPLQILFLRGHYGQVLASFALAGLAGMLVIIGLNAVMGGVETGEADFGRIKERTTTVQGFLNK